MMRSRYFSRLRGRVAEKGSSLKEFAGELNITPQALGNKLSGKSDFTIKEVVAGCNFLECSVAYFFDPELHGMQFMAQFSDRMVCDYHQA